MSARVADENSVPVPQPTCAASTDYWDTLFMGMAFKVAHRSPCLRSQVGAVLAHNHCVVAAASNTVPRQLSCEDCSRRLKTQSEASDLYDDCISLHAEANAVLLSNYVHRGGATLYVTRTPCWGCMKIVVNSGVACVVIPPQFDVPSKLWSFAQSCSVQLRTFKEKSGVLIPSV